MWLFPQSSLVVEGVTQDCCCITKYWMIAVPQMHNILEERDSIHGEGSGVTCEQRPGGLHTCWET